MALGPRIKAAILGDLDGYMKAVVRVAAEGITAAIDRASTGLQEDLRGQVRGAGLGQRVANAWRRARYPRQGQSMSAAAGVFSKAPHIVRAFDEATLIKSRSGLWLAIPTEAAPKKGAGGKRISPSNFPEHRYGRLRFVYRRTGPSLLVVDGSRINASGRVGRQAKNPFLKSGALKKGIATVVMFLLVRQVRLRKRLDVQGATDRWAARLPNLIVNEMKRLDRLEDRT